MEREISGGRKGRKEIRVEPIDREMPATFIAIDASIVCCWDDALASSSLLLSFLFGH